MRHIRLALIIVVISLWVSPTYAQLGPKDGANLTPTDLERVKVGDRAPDFTLENMDGAKVTLSDFGGKKSVVLVFYRGHW
jgi:cytochrome oxidase Cu insertion factor (SCO1/SenC/PrrC family)